MVLRLYLCKRLYSTPRAAGFMSWSWAYRCLSPRIRRPLASFRSSLATSKDRWWTMRVDHIHFKAVYHLALPSLLKKGERRTSEGCTNETGETRADKPPRLSCLKLALGSVLDCVASLRRDVARPILVLYVDRLVSGTAAERPRPARGVRLPGGPGGVFVPVSRECYPARRRRSVALSASVAVRLFVLAAPLFIVTMPMGLSLSTLTFLGAEATDVLPASSVVLAV